MAGLGGDKDAYLERVRALRDEISSGTRAIDTTAVDPRLITENEEVIFVFCDFFMIFFFPPSFSSMLEATEEAVYAYADVC